MFRKLICILACWAAILSGPVRALDKADFETIARVNDSVITRFELEQRILMLEALGTGGDLAEIALENLINERLYAQAANELAIRISQGDVEQGMAEFAARGNVSADEMIAFLAENDVERATFSEFVKAGLMWRAVIQSRFARKAAVPDDEIDNALNLGSNQTQLSLLLSEIVLPFQERGEVETRRLAEELYDTLRGGSDFATAAGRYSSSPSAQNDGRLDWTSSTQLAPRILTQLLALDPGEVTPPVEFPEFVGIFKLHDLRTERVQDPLPVSLNYLLINLPDLPDAPVAAQRMIGRADTCLDMRAVAEKYGQDAISETTVQAGAAPAPLARELARLDRYEASAFANAAGGQSVVMLCNRIRELPEESREGLRQSLYNQRISGFGDSYLQELKGQAFIEIQ